MSSYSEIRKNLLKPIAVKITGCCIKFRIENFKQDKAAALEARSNANKKKAELEAARLIEQAKHAKGKSQLRQRFSLIILSA